MCWMSAGPHPALLRAIGIEGPTKQVQMWSGQQVGASGARGAHVQHFVLERDGSSEPGSIGPTF